MKENKSLEWKEDVTNTFLKTVSAFSNYGGGIIQFGINNNGEITGLTDPEKACLDIENRINDCISPKPDYQMEANPSNGVITLCVLDGPDKPYLYRGRAYKRNDTSTVEVDRGDLNRLVLQGTGQYYDQIEIGGADLSFHVLEQELRDRLNVDEVSRNILKTLNLYSDKGGYNHAAQLFADKNDYPGIDMARFGNGIDEILDRERYAGISILSQYHRSIELFRRYYIYEKIEGSARRQKEKIPEKAFREAIANALVHRAWDVNANIRVLMFEKEVRIISPGGLPFGMSEDDYLKGYVSSLRNPIVAGIFFRLGYIEMFGTGIARIRKAYQNFETAPEFNISENAVSVTLPLTEQQISMTRDERQVYEVMDKGILLSSSEIAMASGFGKDKTIRILNRLLLKHIVKKTGNGRSTRYGI